MRVTNVMLFLEITADFNNLLDNRTRQKENKAKVKLAKQSISSKPNPQQPITNPEQPIAKKRKHTNEQSKQQSDIDRMSEFYTNNKHNRNLKLLPYDREDADDSLNNAMDFVDSLKSSAVGPASVSNYFTNKGIGEMTIGFTLQNAEVLVSELQEKLIPQVGKRAYSLIELSACCHYRFQSWM